MRFLASLDEEKKRKYREALLHEANNILQTGSPIGTEVTFAVGFK